MIDDLLSDFLLGKPATENEQLLDRAFRRYAMQQTGERVLDHVLGSDRRQLQDDDLRLNVAMKRRSLGLPLDDDEYERLMNDGGMTFGEASTGAGLGILGGRQLDEPDMWAKRNRRFQLLGLGGRGDITGGKPPIPSTLQSAANLQPLSAVKGGSNVRKLSSIAARLFL